MTTIDIHQKLQEAFGDAVGPLSEPKMDAFAVVKGDRICLLYTSPSPRD